jgi:hypothetical protein
MTPVSVARQLVKVTYTYMVGWVQTPSISVRYDTVSAKTSDATRHSKLDVRHGLHDSKGQMSY